MVTITGPGKDVLPMDGDQVVRAAAVRWNGSAAARWRRLHRAAAQKARRRNGRLTLVAWSWEYQRRGVLHKHLIVGVETAAELAGAHAYVKALDGLRLEYGFGFVDRGRRHGGSRSLEVIPAERAARYVAKYLSPLDGEGKPTISDTVRRSDVPPLVVYTARAMTCKTGITMRYLRRVRLSYVLGFDPETGETLASIQCRELLRLMAAGVHYKTALGP